MRTQMRLRHSCPSMTNLPQKYPRTELVTIGLTNCSQKIITSIQNNSIPGIQIALRELGVVGAW